MKTTLAVLLSVVSFAAFGQTTTSGFPTLITNLPTSQRSYESVQRLAQNEGYDYNSSVPVTTVSISGTVVSTSINANSNTTTVIYSCNQTLAGTPVTIGNCLIPNQLEFTANKKFSGVYYTPYSNTGPFTAYRFATYPLTGEANERITRQMGAPIHATQRPLNPIVSQITDVISGTVAPANGSTASISFTYTYSVMGWLMTDDLNLSATKYVDIWGDSIWAGSGQTATENMLAFLLREYWTDKGLNFRLRHEWSVPGTTTGQHVGFLKSGVYYREAPSILVICLGPNDVNASISATTITANYMTLINKALAIYPNVKIIVPAITPRGNTTLEAANVTARASIKTAIANAITATPSLASRVFYVETMGTAWTATDNTKYNAADGLLLHPTDTAITGSAFPVLKTFLDANPIIFN